MDPPLLFFFFFEKGPTTFVDHLQSHKLATYEIDYENGCVLRRTTIINTTFIVQ